MEELIGLIIAPIIVFLVIVAPIWLVLHYRSKRQISKGFSEDQVLALNDLAKSAETMAERIQTLEAILDAESPEWRKKA